MWLVKILLLFISVPILLGAEVILPRFSYINNLICAENSAFSSLRSSWDACVYFLSNDTSADGALEQFFCAMAQLRSSLGKLKNTLPADLIPDAESIENWCHDVLSEYANGVTDCSDSDGLRGKHKKNKRSSVSLFAGGVAILAASVCAGWFYLNHKKYTAHESPLYAMPLGRRMYTTSYAAPRLMNYPLSGQSQQQFAGNVLREHLHHLEEADRSLLPQQSGTECFSRPDESRLAILRRHVSFEVAEMSRNQVRLIDPSLEVRVLMGAAAEPGVTDEELERLCRDAAQIKEKMPALLTLPRQGMLLFRQQQALILFSKPIEFENYVHRMLRDQPHKGFFKFTLSLLRQLGDSHEVLDQSIKSAYQCFAQLFVESCHDAISVRCNNPHTPYEGVMSGRFKRQISACRGAEEFAAVCCNDLAEFLVLVFPDRQCDTIMKKIIEIGMSHYVSDASSDGVLSIEQTKEALIGALWRWKRARSVMMRLYAERYSTVGSASGNDDVCRGATILEGGSEGGDTGSNDSVEEEGPGEEIPEETE